MNYITLLPILICFLIIFIKKNPFIAIGVGIISAVIVLDFSSPNLYLISSVNEVLSSPSTVKTTLFVLIVGALVSAIDNSGGIRGIVTFLESKKIRISSKVGVQLFTLLIGLLLFIDSTSSIAITSVVGRPLFKKVGLSKEKLAVIVNSTGSPIAWLIPFGGAGAILAGLISSLDEIGDNAFNFVVMAVPFHFYTFFLLIILFLSSIFNFDIGSIRKLKFDICPKDEEKVDKKALARNMVVPICVLISGIIIVLIITGKGNFLNGDSSDAVFFSGIFTLLFTLVFYKLQGISSYKKCFGWFLKGARTMLMITLLLVMAYVFSNLLTKVGTAVYLVSLFNTIPDGFLPLIALALSAVISISTGTSSGTVAIITPIFLPMALMSGVSIPQIIGAIVSGAVFGDQNSIISDSVIFTSSVTGVDAFTHVKTQLPYTLIALAFSAASFLLLGILT